MAKKQTTQDQDSIREERAYNRERTRIESYENSSKNRARRRVLDGIGKIVTGRRREGVREIREAARQRTEESVRNRVMAQPMRLFIRQRNNARVCRATQQGLKTGNRYPLRTEKSRQMELPARWTQAGKSLKDGKGPTA